jgi:lamin tail-like protein
MIKTMRQRAVVFFGVAFLLAIFSTAALPQQVFFGNLHSHTSYSDGSGLPEEAYLYARDTAHLDFLAITDHNHKDAEDGASADRRDGVLIAKDHTLYVGPQSAAIIPTATRLNQDGKFIALYGQEFSSISKGNHIDVFEIGDVITAENGKFNDLITWLGSHPDSTGSPAIIQFNHPSLFTNADTEYGADDFGSTANWIATMSKHVKLIEIMNGPAMIKDSGKRPSDIMEKDFLNYLNLGFHLAPTADQDNHYRTWGTASDARTAIIADSLTKANLLDAMRKRHVYATEDPNLRIIYRVNDHLMGDIITEMPAVGSQLTIEFTITDDDEPNASYVVDLFSDTGPGGNVAQVVKTITVHGNTPQDSRVMIDGIPFSGPGQYLFLRIKQIDEDGANDLAWTAPVWFEPDGFTGGASSSSNIRISSLLPNPPGDETQNEEATIVNKGTQPVSMVGWRLRDLSHQEWVLDSLGTLQPGESKTIRRAGQSMAMNNGGDSITLVDSNGIQVQTVTYATVSEGQRVSVP